MTWLTGYTTRKKITIDQTKVDGDLTDFPVLVKLTTSNFDFSKANSDGFDIRFTSSDGETLLKYEREIHDGSSLGIYWIKVPSVSGSTDTEIYIYYRTADTADGADPENVWDSNFKAVHHLKDNTTSSVLDSTSNNNDGTKKAANEPVEATGQIYKGQDFDGSDDYINTPAQNLSPTDAHTFEAWFNTTDDSNDGTIVGQGDDTTNTTESGFFLGVNLNVTNGKLAFGAESYATPWQIINSSDVVNDGSWYYAAGVYDNGSMILYLNGEQESTGTDTYKSTKTTGNQYIGIGNFTRNNGINRPFDGKIDEVRISNVARSAAWIKASYNSGNNSLLAVGSEETPTNIKSINGLAKASIKSVNGLAIASVKSWNGLT